MLERRQRTTPWRHMAAMVQTDAEKKNAAYWGAPYRRVRHLLEPQLQLKRPEREWQPKVRRGEL